MFLALLKKEFAELSGTKKLMIIGVLFLFVALSSPITAKMLPEIVNKIPSGGETGISIHLPTPTYLDAIDQLMKNIGQLLAFVLIFVVAGAVADEKTRKTLEMALTKPVSRSNFVLAKAASYLLAVLLAFFVSAAVFYAYTASVFGSFSLVNFIELVMLVAVFLALLVSTLIFCSVVASSSLVASGLGFAALVCYVGIWGLIKPIVEYSPGYIFRNYKVVVNQGWNGDFLWPALVSLVLSILWLWLAVYFFKRQEVER